MMHSLVYFFLFLTGVVGMIDDIESFNIRNIVLKTTIILLFVNFRKDSPIFKWELLAILVVYPIIEFMMNPLNKFNPPFFDHLWPALITFVLLFL